MIRYSVVPQSFHTGSTVQVLKNKMGDTTDSNNYRAITLSSSISKLLEMCIIEMHFDALVKSPLQFGFKKKLSTSHALYTLRCTVKYYVKRGSTVNVALLDISKTIS